MRSMNDHNPSQYPDSDSTFEPTTRQPNASDGHPQRGSRWEVLGGLALGGMLLTTTLLATKSWSASSNQDRATSAQPSDDTPAARAKVTEIRVRIDNPYGVPQLPAESPLQDSPTDVSDRQATAVADTPQPTPQPHNSDDVELAAPVSE